MHQQMAMLSWVIDCMFFVFLFHVFLFFLFFLFFCFAFAGASQGLVLERSTACPPASPLPPPAKVFTAEYSTLAVTVHWLRTAFGLTAEKVSQAGVFRYGVSPPGSCGRRCRKMWLPSRSLVWKQTLVVFLTGSFVTRVSRLRDLYTSMR